MSIELKIDRYCDGNCKAFEAVTKVDDVCFADNIEHMRHISVICKNRHICKQLARKLEKYIRQEIEEENRLNDESRTETSGEGKEESEDGNL